MNLHGLLIIIFVVFAVFAIVFWAFLLAILLLTPWEPQNSQGRNAPPDDHQKRVETEHQKQASS